MAKNADDGADDTDQAAEDILRSAKYPEDDVENSDKEEDETSDGDDTEQDDDEVSDDDGKTDDEAGDEDSEDDSDEQSDDDESEFVKQFSNIKGDTLADYARNLEIAYQNSFDEGLRLKRENDTLKAKDTGTGDDNEDDDDDKSTTPSNPLELYMQQKMDEEIADAYGDFKKVYPQANDQENYDKFRATVATLSRVIMETEKRLAPPKELYQKAAVMLGWEPDKTTSQDKLKVALKDRASVSKTNSSTKKTTKSKVTDQQVALYRKMNSSASDKSDADIRKELEPYA